MSSLSDTTMSCVQDGSQTITSAGFSFTIRRMQMIDVDRCLNIWGRVKLVEARSTLVAAFKFDPEAFFVAENEADGQLIGTCASPLDRHDTAFLGFYAVDPDFQGKGVGLAMWNHVLERATRLKINMGLYGTSKMFQKYMRNGFGVQDSVRIYVYQGCVDKCAVGDKLMRLDKLKANCQALADTSIRLVPIDCQTNEQITQKLYEYDAKIQGYSREKFLKVYLTDPHDAPLTYCLVSGGAKRKNGDRTEPLFLHGYGCMKIDNDCKALLGPLYANSWECCEVLLGELLDKTQPELALQRVTTMCMTEEHNVRANNTWRKLGLKPIEQCVRLFTKHVPPIRKEFYHEIFAIHSANFSMS